jgi:hypothetical protein
VHPGVRRVPHHTHHHMSRHLGPRLSQLLTASVTSAGPQLPPCVQLSQSHGLTWRCRHATMSLRGRHRSLLLRNGPDADSRRDGDSVWRSRRRWRQRLRSRGPARLVASTAYGGALPSGAWDGAVHGSLSSRATRVRLPRIRGARTNAQVLYQTCMSDADGSDGGGEAPGVWLVDHVGGGGGAAT